MKIKRIAIVIGLFLALFLVPGAWAQETTDLPDPGLTPDSPLYFLETWSEKIDLALTRNKEAKIKKQVRISQKKLSEAKVMAEEGKVEASEVAIGRYEQLVSGAAGNLAQAAQTGEGFAGAMGELLATTTAISQEVLAGVYEQVPEEARGAIERAMQVSSEGMEGAMEAVSNVRREEVQNKINESLERARENMPEEAKQHIPGGAPGDETEEGIPGGVQRPDQEQEVEQEQGEEQEQGGSMPIDVPGAGRP